jgi:hypothetical protein
MGNKPPTQGLFWVCGNSPAVYPSIGHGGWLVRLLYSSVS